MTTNNEESECCPICGYPDSPPYPHSICPCCEVEYSFDDYPGYLKKWLQAGATFGDAPAPLSWNLLEQVENVDLSQFDASDRQWVEEYLIELRKSKELYKARLLALTSEQFVEFLATENDSQYYKNFHLVEDIFNQRFSRSEEFIGSQLKRNSYRIRFRISELLTRKDDLLSAYMEDLLGLVRDDSFNVREIVLNNIDCSRLTEKDILFFLDDEQYEVNPNVINAIKYQADSSEVFHSLVSKIHRYIGKNAEVRWGIRSIILPLMHFADKGIDEINKLSASSDSLLIYHIVGALSDFLVDNPDYDFAKDENMRKASTNLAATLAVRKQTAEKRAHSFVSDSSEFYKTIATNIDAILERTPESSEKVVNRTNLLYISVAVVLLVHIVMNYL